MKITKINQVPITKTMHNLETKRIYDKESAQAVHIKLYPGEALKPHITPVDVFFYILQGNPEILVGKQRQTVECDCIVESPKDIPHCIYNNSSKLVRVLVVKAPRPTTSTKLL